MILTLALPFYCVAVFDKHISLVDSTGLIEDTCSVVIFSTQKVHISFPRH